MALYEVSRTDEVEPGGFVSALVIAGGTAQAREAVKHLNGGSTKSLRAVRQDVTGGPMLLTSYFDETPEDAAEFNAMTFEQAFGGGNW